LAQALKVFRIIRFFSFKDRCEHYLLARATRPAFPTGSDKEKATAVDQLDWQFNQTQKKFEKTLLPSICSHNHETELFGELQDLPFGDEFYAGHSGDKFDIWVTPTRAGHPSVIFGVADDEEDFWQQLEDPDNEDLVALKPIKAARKVNVVYIKGD
jgi:hypothetical protein